GPEALIRLRACFWLYRPHPAAPEPAPQLPVRAAARLTFASLNYTHKLNAGVAAAWAGILNRFPGARLLLFSDCPAQHAPLARLFADAGLGPGRLDLAGRVPQV